jgi:hydroxysqualene dehydroxylase
MAADTASPRLAVVGAGWAGLAAAVRAQQAGFQVVLLEMAPSAGGRARSLAADEAGWCADNGQHILIGAYVRTLALLDDVGVDASHVLQRRPLVLRDPQGLGLKMPRGPAWLVFGLAVAQARGWRGSDKLALLAAAARWLVAGFRCPPTLTVQGLCAGLPAPVRQRLIDPLCVAALNTPAAEASATVFLRVLRDSLFAARGSSDLLLPQRPLAQLLPEPALAWLLRQGAEVHLGRRVSTLEASGHRGWRVDGQAFDAVVLATPPQETARLTASVAAAWSARAAAFRHEPIVTVWIDAPGLRLAEPMTALLDGPAAPAQFVFDHGQLGGPAGRLAFVVSGAAPWVERGLDTTAGAVLAQARTAFAGRWPAHAQVHRALAEKRATFRCVPGLDRPPQAVAPGLLAAGDWLEGPYPATLEGAVRSGEAAVRALQGPQDLPQTEQTKAPR